MTQSNKSDEDPQLDIHVKDKLFRKILDDFKASINDVFSKENELDGLYSSREIPPSVLHELMSGSATSLCIPTQYGGFGGNVKENLAFLSEVSYESLALSLSLGINNGLFIQPVAKYGQESAKAKVFDQFKNESRLGGLMITEPGFGSDALNMKTSFSEKDGFFHLQGKKHWAGLTGMADFWLLTARGRAVNGDLMRDLDMFICDVNAPRQNIVVEETFETLGLYEIPYGRNSIDVHIPEDQRLIPHSTGIQMLLDLLHRSRFQFPGMGLGFLKRILDEAISHTKLRLVGNKSLSTYDQVQNRLTRLQTNFTICSAFCLKSSEIAGVEINLSSFGMEANIIKSITSDMMQESAQSLLQLFGAKGYQRSSMAGRAVVDSRPFQIFEGSNDILYHQVADSAFKFMKTTKEKNFYQFLKSYAPCAVERVKDLVEFNLNVGLSQRKLVELGQIISRVVSMDYVLYLAGKGFRKDLIDNALILLKQDISTLLNTFHSENSTIAIVDYKDNSDWFNFS